MTVPQDAITHYFFFADQIVYATYYFTIDNYLDLCYSIESGAAITVGGRSFIRGTELPVYIENPPIGEILKGGVIMSDYELLTLVFMVLGIIAKIIIEYIKK
jgi:hypothetical protein